jgi:hypothetical protein
MDQKDNFIHPMNEQEAMVARFQFLAIPHGDGLDMNEPSYNLRVKEYLESLTNFSISEIISQEGNDILKNNLYVIPFLYARYKAKPSSPEVYLSIEEMIKTNPNQDNEHIAYLSENFNEIIYGGKPDVDGRYAITPFRLFLIKNRFIGPIVFGAALLAAAYLILFFIGGL